jgi:hypothetical protein
MAIEDLLCKVLIPEIADHKLVGISLKRGNLSACTADKRRLSDTDPCNQQ